ncbi:MAG: type II secretion system F family protein [Candidatus Aenigmatarchaeota archaeon]
MVIPFLPFRLDKAKEKTRWLLGLGGKFEKTVPGLKMNLFQSNIDASPREWTAIAIFATMMYFVLFGVVIGVLNVFVGHPQSDIDMLISSFTQVQFSSIDAFFSSFSMNVMQTAGMVFKPIDLILPVGVAFAFGGFVFFYLMKWPSLVVTRHVRELERQMLTALHHMLIEIKSGVPLFNALVAVSEGYGEISNEFRRVVNDINSGMPENVAMDNASRRNTSLHFRRSLWQIVDALRSGSSVATALEAVVNNLVNEQMIAVHKYGQELNPYIMIYMLIAVIMPSLGITFLIILSSFSGIAIPKLLFPLILFGLAMFQVFFMGMIKVRRPVGMV